MSKTFKDNQGRSWTIALDAPTIAMVRSETCEQPGCKHRPHRDPGCEGVDLADVSGEVHKQLDADVVLFVGVLYLVCRAQAQAADIGPEQFAAALGGDAIALASLALTEACAEFLPPLKRHFLTKVAARHAALRELALERSLAKIEDPATQEELLEALDAKLDEVVRECVRELTPASESIPSSSATSSPASSASAPTG